VLLTESIQQLAAVRIRQRLEHLVVISTHAAIICNLMVACQAGGVPPVPVPAWKIEMNADSA
jgi:hypothetical protein